MVDNFKSCTTIIKKVIFANMLLNLFLWQLQQIWVDLNLKSQLKF